MQTGLDALWMVNLIDYRQSFGSGWGKLVNCQKKTPQTGCPMPGLVVITYQVTPPDPIF